VILHPVLICDLVYWKQNQTTTAFFQHFLQYFGGNYGHYYHSITGHCWLSLT